MATEAGFDLVLASGSATRAALLRAAGLAVLVDPAAVDEDEAKGALRGSGAGPSAAAEALAELKAQRVSRRRPGTLVLGCDQLLECEGAWFDKPADRAAARRQLLALRGRTHRLHSAAVAVRDGGRVWQHVATAALTMRPFGEAFLDSYLERAGDAVLGSVGAYQLEGLGAQLFTRVEGDWFTVLGLPLLPLLGFLRDHRVLPS
jgi:septum formation protein